MLESSLLGFSQHPQILSVPSPLFLTPSPHHLCHHRSFIHSSNTKYCLCQGLGKLRQSDPGPAPVPCPLPWVTPSLAWWRRGQTRGCSGGLNSRRPCPGGTGPWWKWIPPPVCTLLPAPVRATPKGPWPVQGSCEEQTLEFGAFGGKGPGEGRQAPGFPHSCVVTREDSSACPWLSLLVPSQGSARALLSPSCQRHLSPFPRTSRHWQTPMSVPSALQPSSPSRCP